MKLLKSEETPKILVVGTHEYIIQSILDFDFVSGKKEPSIIAVVGSGRKAYKCYFGPNECVLPVYQSMIEAAKVHMADWLLNLASANSARTVTEDFFSSFPNAYGAHIFAEGMREQDAVALSQSFGKERAIVGPSGVGLLVPGTLKLGAIGGIFGGALNLLASERGRVAIVCSSGGMVNELIDTIIRSGGAPSLAISYGGDRFPITTIRSWCEYADADPNTEAIIFFGELGGQDEYELAAALQEGSVRKPVYAYIAGRYQASDANIQFGHAKALAQSPAETAFSKQEALYAAGAYVFATYADFIAAIAELPQGRTIVSGARQWRAPDTARRTSLFTAVRDRGSSSDSFVRHALCTLLECETVSAELVTFTEIAYSCLIDHGAEPSGAVTTMITARAGRDMSSSVASGILTVGDRFGGAINAAACTWYEGVRDQVDVEELLEKFKRKVAYVPGIGHKYYSLHRPDPRVESLLSAARECTKSGQYRQYAESVASRTSEKKANLILNVDGAIAACVLDILVEHEEYTVDEIKQLLETEFFNSYFIIPRTVGFIGQYLGQKRHDEGLFRLPNDEVFYL